MATLTRAHCWIRGRVQGVFYRVTARDQACAHNVTGWVRNLADGRVEAVFDGEASDVAAMVAWCRTGSPGALVEDVEVRWEEVVGAHIGFTVRPSASVC